MESFSIVFDTATTHWTNTYTELKYVQYSVCMFIVRCLLERDAYWSWVFITGAYWLGWVRLGGLGWESLMIREGCVL